MSVDVDRLRFVADRCDSLAEILDGIPLTPVVIEFDGPDGEQVSQGYTIPFLIQSIGRMIRQALPDAEAGT